MSWKKTAATCKTKIIDDVEEIKKIALKLLSNHGKISAGRIWLLGRISYSNARKVVDLLEAEGRTTCLVASDVFVEKK